MNNKRNSSRFEREEFWEQQRKEDEEQTLDWERGKNWPGDQAHEDPDETQQWDENKHPDSSD